MPSAQHYLDNALSALAADDDWRAAIDSIPVPVYTTDPEGIVTYSNQACAEFAGRHPEVGTDRWCVTWQLYTMAGDPLPHDRCPMADAIREERPIRNKVAIAARPDGSRRAFRPYPTPLFDSAGKLTGAVNMLIDVSEEQSHALEEQASRCRRLSRSMSDRATATILDQMASDYSETAAALRKAEAATSS